MLQSRDGHLLSNLTGFLDCCLCRLPGAEGVYVASGHSCWGILNGPATGEAMAQLISQGKSTTSLAAFDPARFVTAGRRR